MPSDLHVEYTCIPLREVQPERTTNIFPVARCSLNYTVDQVWFVYVNVNFCFLYSGNLPLISLPVARGFPRTVDFQGRRPSLSRNVTSVRLINVPGRLVRRGTEMRPSASL